MSGVPASRAEVQSALLGNGELSITVLLSFMCNKRPICFGAGDTFLRPLKSYHKMDAYGMYAYADIKSE